MASTIGTHKLRIVFFISGNEQYTSIAQGNYYHPKGQHKSQKSFVGKAKVWSSPTLRTLISHKGTKHNTASTNTSSTISSTPVWNNFMPIYRFHGSSSGAYVTRPGKPFWSWPTSRSSSDEPDVDDFNGYESSWEIIWGDPSWGLLLKLIFKILWNCTQATPSQA